MISPFKNSLCDGHVGHGVGCPRSRILEFDILFFCCSKILSFGIHLFTRFLLEHCHVSQEVTAVTDVHGGYEQLKNDEHPCRRHQILQEKKEFIGSNSYLPRKYDSNTCVWPECLPKNTKRKTSLPRNTTTEENATHRIGHSLGPTEQQPQATRIRSQASSHTWQSFFYKIKHSIHRKNFSTRKQNVFYSWNKSAFTR